jgi:2,3-dihydroxyphenylpropionate 1,2-dioxygenase
MDTSKLAPQGRRSGVIGAAIVPHAPQFLTRPKSEDLAQIGRVREAMEAVGEGLRRLEPDLVIIISNCHGEELVAHCVPPFMIHCADRAEGVAAHRGTWRVDGEAGLELMEKLLDEGFDPAFTIDVEVATPFTIAHEFCGFARDAAFLPIYVNAYMPPQPQPERCFAFGKALARCLERMGRRAVIIASGGLSHYPATPMYPTPDLATDRGIFERLVAGNLNYLMSFDSKRLDKTGNVECRTLQILAGAIGDHTPDLAVLEPSWHHIYAVIGWTKPLEPESYFPYYPGFLARHSQLARAIHAIATSREACETFTRDREAFAETWDLSADARSALVTLDEDVLRERFSISPMLTFQAKFQTGDNLKDGTPVRQIMDQTS